MALPWIILVFGLSSQAQDLKFSDTPYSTPVFSATFPAGTEVIYEHTKDAEFDTNTYSAGQFTVGYTDFLKRKEPITKLDLDRILGIAQDGAITMSPTITDSTLIGLPARKTSNTVKNAFGDVFPTYMRIAVSGNQRVWLATILCDQCKQADADKFFDSIKIK